VSERVELSLPDSLVEAIVEQATERVLERVAETNGRSPWLTAAEAADYLRWPVKRIYNLTAAGAIPHRKHEGRVLFHRNELDSWLNRYREG
jgi:excisionase family DNA binding protein